MKQRKYLIMALLLLSIPSDVLLSNKKKHGKPTRPTKRPEKTKPTKYYERIIEGVKAQYSDYPFMASLLYYDVHMCGGSIISETVILTAAHCCSDVNDELFDTEDLTVAVGNSNWQHGDKFKVDKYIVHENFNSDQFINDVALWVLKDKMSYLSTVKPIRLASRPVNENHKPISATVLGWGYTSHKGFVVEEVSDDLFKVNIYSIPLAECRKHHDDIYHGHICFTSPDRRGSCLGDSGGPLVVRKDSKFIQIGLVSYGEDCNNTKPEVYTRIPSYYKWIKRNVFMVREENQRKNG